MSITRRAGLSTALLLAALLAGGALWVAIAPATGDLWWRVVLEVQTVQRSLHRELTATLQAVQAHGATAGWWLVTLSFLYGIFHAAGPGHGKVVITTYLLTQPSRLGRGIALSLLAALCQGLTAVLTVGISVALLGHSLRSAQSTANDLEVLSYALVALAGLVLVVSRVRRLTMTPVPNEHTVPLADPDERHGSADVAAGGCCHGHAPRAELLDAPLSWRAIAGMTLAIGIRPCSGAILVLLVAHSIQLHWAGVSAVLAMSLGTAITVSVLAAISVYARAHAIRLAARLPGPSALGARAFDIVALVGGLIILIAGAMLVQASWAAPAHPLY